MVLDAETVTSFHFHEKYAKHASCKSTCIYSWIDFVKRIKLNILHANELSVVISVFSILRRTALPALAGSNATDIPIQTTRDLKINV